jgi:nudix-type nucleoside diphosphatase (YffH/AdpP family)
MSISDRIRVRDVRTLSDDHFTLRKTVFDWRRSDGAWQTATRQTFDRGDGVALLPYNLSARTVLLVRQFRYPVFVNGHDDLLVEAAAGVLDDADPEARMRAEAEEELGYRLQEMARIFTCFMSPGAVTEKITFFVAPYDASMRIGAGGGLRAEGEDIEVLELPFDAAMEMIARGEIVDGKTVMLLQYAALNLFR